MNTVNKLGKYSNCKLSQRISKSSGMCRRVNWYTVSYKCTAMLRNVRNQWTWRNILDGLNLQHSQSADFFKINTYMDKRLKQNLQ